jgi:hypothetical protein
MHRRRGQYVNPTLAIDFAPVAERQPVLACLLRRLLLNDRLEEALQLADSYSSGPHFARSMEWLLYTALESNDKARQNAELTKTAELISNFSEYSQLVVSVARKIDADMWPALFNAAGSPVDLCESSIRDGALQHAAASLLIVHDVVGAQEACRLAIKTLKSAVKTSKYELCAEIMCFLGDMVDIASANRRSDADAGPGAGDRASGGYATWLWNWIAPVDQSGGKKRSDTSNGSNGAISDMGAAPAGDASGLQSTTEKLHASLVVGDKSKSASPSDTSFASLVEAWEIMAKHAWRVLDDGNVRELASLDRAMSGVHGGLVSLLHTTKHMHSCSLGHITPSASLIANALFIAGNELASASEAELEEIPGLMQTLLEAGCINYALALAIVSNNVPMMNEFAEHNQHTWDSLLALISNDVHLCSFASVLMSVGAPSSVNLPRSATL